MKTQEERSIDFFNLMREKHPNIEIAGEYKTLKSKLTCRCKIHTEYIWTSTAESLKYGNGCKYCSWERVAKNQLLTHEKFQNNLSTINSDIILLSEYRVLKSDINCKCKKCGYKWIDQPRYLLNKSKCPLCNDRVVIKGRNDISTTHPYLTKYFKNPEEAYTHTYKSIYKATFKCPDCGKEFSRKIRSIIERGFHCTFCDKGISLPNRMIRNLLELLNVDNFEYEYSPDWAGKQRYDAYFTQNSIPYIVEMDGGFHYKATDLKGRTEYDLETIKAKDSNKTQLANEHGIEIIRIPCDPSTIPNIRNNILQSKLSTMFDLTQINWDELLYCNKSLMSQICKCYNSLQNKTAGNVSKILKINKGVVGRYLREANKKGLCQYDGAESRRKSNCIPIKCTKIDTQESYEFESMVAFYNSLLKQGINCDKSTIKYHLKMKTPYLGYMCEYAD